MPRNRRSGSAGGRTAPLRRPPSRDGSWRASSAARRSRRRRSRIVRPLRRRLLERLHGSIGLPRAQQRLAEQPEHDGVLIETDERRLPGVHRLRIPAARRVTGADVERARRSSPGAAFTVPRTPARPAAAAFATAATGPRGTGAPDRSGSFEAAACAASANRPALACSMAGRARAGARGHQLVEERTDDSRVEHVLETEPRRRGSSRRRAAPPGRRSRPHWPPDRS